MPPLFRIFLPLLLFFISLSIVGQEQQASWRGTKILKEDQTTSNADGSISFIPGKAIYIKLILLTDSTWDISFTFESSSTNSRFNNASTQPFHIKFEFKLFDSVIAVNGIISEDSSEVSCTVTKGNSKNELTLKRLPPPITWSGDTTINNERVLLKLTFQ